MFLRDIARVIYAEDTASMNTTITVKTYNDEHKEYERVLWTGRAKDLQTWTGLGGWIVVEILIDPTTDVERFPGIETSLCNRGKIISVM